MRWEDERYVRLYTRDTGDWLLLGWEARSLFALALRKADRAGIVQTGRAGVRGLAVLVGMPADVVERALPELLADGCLATTEGGFCIPNFMAAQDVPISDAQRKRDERARARAKAMSSKPAELLDGMSRDVTNGHDVTRSVTPSRAEPCLTEPLKALSASQTALPLAEKPKPPTKEKPTVTTPAYKALTDGILATHLRVTGQTFVPLEKRDWPSLAKLRKSQNDGEILRRWGLGLALPPDNWLSISNLGQLLSKWNDLGKLELPRPPVRMGTGDDFYDKQQAAMDAKAAEAKTRGAA